MKITQKRNLFLKAGNRGFTLAEMIIVVTILAVLGAIGFLTFSKYNVNARDTVRKTDLNTVTKFLQLDKLNSGEYPIATDAINVTYSGVTLWSQGVFGKDTQIDLGKHIGELKDPLYENHYTYSVTNNKQEYQIAALFENGNPDGIGDAYAFDFSVPRFLDSTYAAGEFSPLELSPKIWLDGEDIDGDGATNDNPSNNANVTSWANKSSAGSANDPILTDGNLKYSTSGYDSSYPGVYIAANKGLHLSNSDITSGDIFYVVQNNDPFNGTDRNGHGLQSTNAINYSIGYWGSRSYALRISNAPKKHNTSPASSSYRTSPYIWSFHTDNTNYAFYDTGRIIHQGSTSSITGQTWGFNKAGATNAKADFVVSEILVFGTKLSTTDREKIEGYLAHKWGQDYWLPNDHPYKNTPPDGGTPPTPDTTPDAFTLSDVTDAAVSTQYTSNAITVSGTNTTTTISISGGEYSINNGTYTSSVGTIDNDDTVSVRQTSSAAGSTTTSVSLSIGGVNEQYDVTTLLIDTTPDSFSFSAVNDADVSTQYTSNTATVSGLNTTTPISISGAGAEYKIGDGVPYDATGAGTASASSSYSGNQPSKAFDNNTSNNGWGNNGSLPAILTYDFGSGNAEIISKYTLFRSNSQNGGWGWDGYSPKNWTFEGSNNGSSWSVLDTRTNEYIYANSTKKEFSVSGAGLYRYYRINISSAVNSNWVNITEMELINEEGSGIFTSTSGTVENDDIVSVRLTSSANAGTATTGSLTIGTFSSDYVVTTVAPDSTPDNFSFNDEIDAPLSSTQTSNTITISGINTASVISISGGGTYSINGGGFTSSVGSVDSGNTVRVRLTASASNSVTVSSVLTIGGVNATYNVTTPAPPPDSTPDAFSFTDITDALVSTQYASDTITVSGINASTSISISGGGEYRKNSGSFTSSSSTVVNGDTVSVRNTSHASAGNTVNTSLTIGGVSDTYSITTVAPDTSPDDFSLNTISDADISTGYSSDPITITGINSPTLAQISAGVGQIRINGASAVASGLVNNGDIIIVELTASSSWATGASTTLDVGGKTGNFVVTTGAGDTTPDAFVFSDIVDVNLATEYISTPITITGINAPTGITIVGGEYRIGSDTLFTTTPGQITNNQEITIRATSANGSLTTTSTTVTIGGINDSFDLTTLDFTPAESGTSTPTSNMYVKGDYNGLFVHGSSGNTHYVVAAPSIITTDFTDTDIQSIIANKKFVYNNFQNIPASYDGNNLTMTGGFDFTIQTPLLYEGSKEDLGSYGGLQQIDSLVRTNYINFPAYYEVADKLDTFGLSYVEDILANSVGINPIKPYYCNDIKNSKLLYNIAPKAVITASPSAYNSYGTGGIANGIKSSEGDLDYEYHSASGNAKITFDWPSVQKVGFVKIFNRTQCCSDRLSGGIIKLYDSGDNLIYSHPLWDTTGDYVIDLDLEGIGQLHYVKKMTLETVGGNLMNLREVEIYTGGDVIDGVYKVDRDGAGGQSPYNVYCDMTTDGGGWTRIGENYVTNGEFTGQNHISEHTFLGYSNPSDNVIVSQATQEPPSYIPEAFVMRHAGSASEYYQLEFEDVPGSFFAQEIRLSIWQKDTSSSLFAYEIDYIDGGTEAGTAELETLETEGAWTRYLTRIPLASEVQDFTWNIGDGVPGTFYFTDPQMEIYYR